jgi:4-diphosphocytidyl-2-C-methyl-D-erythritol kinase
VEKNIPICSGLGGGSSNGAIFLLMLNRELNLNLSLQELVGISTDVGSDLAFFLHNINSANVYGRGDIIENFKEDEIELDIYTPKIKCITKDVYNRYKITNNKFKNIIDIKTVLKNNSKELINKLSINQANDLYEPAVNLYPKLKTLTKKNYYFSGSGSSFFKIL